MAIRRATMLLCWPLAGLSFTSALTFWVVVGAMLCAWPLARMLGSAARARDHRRAGLLPQSDVGAERRFHGGAAAGGLALLDRRPGDRRDRAVPPRYKPQLGLLIPVALAAGGQRRRFRRGGTHRGPAGRGQHRLARHRYLDRLLPSDEIRPFQDRIDGGGGEVLGRRMPTVFAGAAPRGGCRTLGLCHARIVRAPCRHRRRRAIPRSGALASKSAALESARFATPYAGS